MNQLNQFTAFIRRCGWAFGIEIGRFQKSQNYLLHHKIDLVLDVGANIGQYGSRVRAEGYRNRIVSFEPLSSAYDILKNFAKSDKSWFIHERCAVGSRLGETEINISKNSYSSSLLPMCSILSDAAPNTIYIGKDRTKIINLDSIFGDYHNVGERVFLKVDTQGYEKEVLDGAKDCLKHITGVQLELSVVPLYESQQLYDYFFQYMKEAGFYLWALVPGFSNEKSGQILQFDGIFFRP